MATGVAPVPFPQPTLRFEDVLLAGWNLLVLPLGLSPGGDGPSVLIGMIQALAIVGVIVALATRTPGLPPLTPDTFRGWAVAGPLIGAVAFVGDAAGDNLGFDVSMLGIVAFVAVVTAFVLADRLPVIPEWQRRVAVTPFLLITTSFFTGLVADLFDGVEILAIARALFDGSTAAPAVAGVSAILLTALVAGSATFYAMLVVAPRELAAPEPLARVWLVRFAVFVVSAVVGAAGIVVL